MLPPGRAPSCASEWRSNGRAHGTNRRRCAPTRRRSETCPLQTVGRPARSKLRRSLAAGKTPAHPPDNRVRDTDLEPQCARCGRVAVAVRESAAGTGGPALHLAGEKKNIGGGGGG